MQPSTDLLIDRKRLKSRIKRWQLLAIVAVFGSLAMLSANVTPGRKSGPIVGDFIALVTINDAMTDNLWREETLEEIANNPRAKALLVRFDSPGGTAMAGEELYIQLQKVAKRKPVVGVMRTLCASACYMASLGADYVVARESTLTGSIGVLLESVEVSRLADKLGITPVTITSGAMKDAPSLTKPMTEEQRRVITETVHDVYDQFVAKIVARRKLDEARVRTLADGRVYTGAQAVKLNLIDAVGGQDEAIAWLVSKRNVKAGLAVQEIKEEPEFNSLFEQLGSYAQQKILGKTLVKLDGLVSIWHPSALK